MNVQRYEKKSNILKKILSDPKKRTSSPLPEKQEPDRNPFYCMRHTIKAEDMR